MVEMHKSHGRKKCTGKKEKSHVLYYCKQCVIQTKEIPENPEFFHFSQIFAETRLVLVDLLCFFLINIFLDKQPKEQRKKKKKPIPWM